MTNNSTRVPWCQRLRPIRNYRWHFCALFIFCIGFTNLATAQSKTWEKTYGVSSVDDNLSATIKTADGGYLLGGSTKAGQEGNKSEASRGDSDMWIVKLDSKGHKQWDKSFGGKSTEYLRDIITTSDGGYLLGGVSNSNKSGDKSQNSQGRKDFWIVKIDAQGNKQWDKAYGGSKDDGIVKMVVAPDGGYLLAGTSNSSKSGDKSQDLTDSVFTEDGYLDFWVVKIDEKGTKLWDKAYSGNSRDVLTSVVVSPDGGYLLGGDGGLGVIHSNVLDGSCNERGGCLGFWIIKITATGQQQWDKKINFGSSRYSEYYLGALLVTADGGYLVGGTTNIGFNYSILVAKINASGKQQWIKLYDDVEKVEVLNTMVRTPDGGYMLGGYSGERVGLGVEPYSWLVKTDAAGERIWDGTVPGFTEVKNLIARPDNNFIITGPSKDYQIAQINYEPEPAIMDWNMGYGSPQEDNLTTTIQTADGGYLAGGYTYARYGNHFSLNQGKNDYWIIKTNSNGKIDLYDYKSTWTRQYGGKNHDYLNSIIQTRDGGYLLAGSSLSGQTGHKTQPSKGNRDYWIIKLDARGDKQWDKSFGGSGYDELKKVVQLSTGEYVLGGYSNSPAGHDKSQDNQGGTDYWLVKISSTGAKIWDKRYGGSANEELGSFIETKDGGFLLGGSSLSGKTGDKSESSRGERDYWVVKTDKAGKLLWNKTYGGFSEDKAYTVGLSQGENLFIAGTSSSGKGYDKTQASKGGKDFWLVTFNKNGDMLWEKTLGGSQDDYLRASTFTQAGHIVLAGSSYSGISGDKTEASQGISDFWIVAVDENGNKVYDKGYGRSTKDELRTITLTQDGGLLLGGRSDSVPPVDMIWATGSTDFWFVKTYPIGSPVVAARTSTVAPVSPETLTEMTTFNAYPNPFQDKVTVSFILSEAQAATVRVLDGQGRVITTLFQGEAKANQTYQVEWQAGKQTSGMYLLQLQTPTIQNTRKLLLNK